MASADGNNGGKWDKNFVAALFAIVIGAIVTIATPELRKCFRLKDSETMQQPPEVRPSPLPQPAPPPVHPPIKEKKTAQLPSSYILHADEPQFVETADAELSFSLTTIKKESIVSLHIAPDGRKPSNHAVWTGDSAEFSSASGEFLVSILSVNVDEKKISVQVSKTGSKN